MTYVRDRLSSLRTRKPKILRPGLRVMMPPIELLRTLPNLKVKILNPVILVFIIDGTSPFILTTDLSVVRMELDAPSTVNTQFAGF